MKLFMSFAVLMAALSPVLAFAGQERGGDENPDRVAPELVCRNGSDSVEFVDVYTRNPRVSLLSVNGLDYADGHCKPVPGADEYAASCTVALGDAIFFKVELFSVGTPELFAKVTPVYEEGPTISMTCAKP
jgi:hypothetical protein